MTRAHPVTPCENCPYRLDAPRRLWHRSEFENVLKAEADQIGRIFNCHKHAKLPEVERGFCAGWLLDQKQRGCPSIALRIAFIHHPEDLAALEAVNARGIKLFPTVKQMCRANGVRSKGTA